MKHQRKHATQPPALTFLVVALMAVCQIASESGGVAQAFAPAAPFAGRSVADQSYQQKHQQEQPSSSSFLFSSLKEVQGEAATQEEEAAQEEEFVELSKEEFESRLNEQLEKLRKVDETSMELTKESLDVVFEDKDLIVINKPSGVLTLGGKEKHPNLADATFDNFEVNLPTADHMIVQRLPMDVSGVIALAKNMDALRKMNGAFRERKVERKYEVLVCGHVKKSEGIISLPLMRDYECPPFVRISTLDHQRALLVLEEQEGVAKKYLEMPKDCRTQYLVESREELEGQPVTRLSVTMHTGRYHQLNCHMAALGHPIVGDTLYGIDGDALPNGGLTAEEQDALIPNRRRATEEIQRAISEIAKDKDMGPCVHHKSIQFSHPLDKFETINFVSEAPF